MTRKEILDAIKKRQPLRGVDLSSADLNGVDLSKVDLSETNLAGVYLREANLGWANLRKANLCQAYLVGANLRKANLRQANLSEADLSGADLSGADLTGAYLDNADLSRVDLSGADLSETRGIIRLPVGDPRGYDCLAVLGKDNTWRITAGYHQLTIEMAFAHWGDNYKGKREIGDRYLAALSWFQSQLTSTKGLP